MVAGGMERKMIASRSKEGGRRTPSKSMEWQGSVDGGSSHGRARVDLFCVDLFYNLKIVTQVI